MELHIFPCSVVNSETQFLKILDPDLLQRRRTPATAGVENNITPDTEEEGKYSGKTLFLPNGIGLIKNIT